MGSGVSVPISVKEALDKGFTHDDIDDYLVAVASKSGIPGAAAFKSGIPGAAASKSVIPVPDAAASKSVIPVPAAAASKSGIPAAAASKSGVPVPDAAAFKSGIPGAAASGIAAMWYPAATAGLGLFLSYMQTLIWGAKLIVLFDSFHVEEQSIVSCYIIGKPADRKADTGDEILEEQVHEAELSELELQHNLGDDGNEFDGYGEYQFGGHGDYEHPVWQKYIDEESGYPYYYNSATQVVLFDWLFSHYNSR